MVKLLIEHKVDVNKVNMLGSPPITETFGQPEIMIQLIEAGANLNVEDEFGMTPLASAAYRGDLQIVRLLIKKGAKVNHQSQRGADWTALKRAAQAGHVEICRFLISHGADVNLKDKYGRSALSAAAEYGKSEVASLLLSKHADVNVVDKARYTPLHWAAIGGFYEIAQNLIAAGAELNTENGEGFTPLSLSIRMNQTKVASLLKRRGAVERSPQ